MPEIAIDVQHGRIVPKRACGDETADARTDSYPRASAFTIQMDGVVEHASGQRILEDDDIGKGRHRHVEGPPVIDALKYFLHHRQARDNLFTTNRIEVSLGCAPAEHLDPGTRVDKNHQRRSPPAMACSRS